MKKNMITILGAVLLVTALIGLDQYTKYLAVVHLAGKDPIALIPGVFELRYLENHGAAFGILQNKQIFFYILTVIVLIGLVWLFLFRIPSDKKYLPLNLLALFMMAGAAGNLIDRAAQSYVVDFLYFRLIDFPIFNVADIYVTVTCVLFFLCIMFIYKEEDLKEII